MDNNNLSSEKISQLISQRTIQSMYDNIPSDINSDKYNRIISRLAIGLGVSKKSDPEDRKKIHALYKNEIFEIIRKLPKKTKYAIIAAVFKCSLVYGKEKTFSFCRKYKNRDFHGIHDPVKLIWNHEQMNLSGKKLSNHQVTDDLYRRTITACRAYCNGKTLRRIRPAQQDVFDWDENFTISKNSNKLKINLPARPTFSVKPKAAPRNSYLAEDLKYAEVRLPNGQEISGKDYVQAVCISQLDGFFD